MYRWLSWVTIVLWAGCSGGTTAPATTDAGAPAEAATTAVEAAEDAATPAVEVATSPATRQEIASLCKLYRKALRSRWDDARTRQEVGALELSTSTAMDWQRDLTGGDVDVALAASRELVTAAVAADLTAECEPLLSLVTLSEAMQAAPGALQR